MHETCSIIVLCVCVRLSVQTKINLLVQASTGLHVRVIHNECNLRFICAEFDKTYGLKVMASFYGDPIGHLRRGGEHQQMDFK